MQSSQLPEVSATLKGPISNCLGWLQDNMEFSALCGGILSIIHPEQYHLGREALLQLQYNPHRIREPQHLATALAYWITPFSGISVIANRSTPVHRDMSTRKNWYDLLVTLGPYSFLSMKLPGLGVEVSYESGTIVGILGRIVPHSVEEASGERVCVSYFMRDNVLDLLGLPGGPWHNIGDQVSL